MTKASGKNKNIKTLEIAQFSENFEEKIIICHILKDMTIEMKLNEIKINQPKIFT